MSVSSPSLSFQQFEHIVINNEYNLIPLYITLHVDLETPVSAYIKYTNNEPYSFLLESVEGGEHQARYSYIGSKPYKIYKQDNVDPLINIENEIRSYNVMIDPSLPTFSGGAVGYIGYDCIKYWERKVPISENNTMNLPESIFMMCRNVLIFDHVKHTVVAVTHLHVDKNNSNVNIQQLYNDAINELHSVIDKLQSPLNLDNVYNNINEYEDSAKTDIYKYDVGNNMYSNMGQAGYEDVVRKLQHHINIGDIIQAVPSHRCRRKLQHNTNALDVYRSLRIVNPSPYMFYIQYGDFQIVGASPEQLVKVESNRRVSTHPIAGTRRRGYTEQEDLELEQDLLNDTKERAEHIMLVDLGRNDIGRIATPGTVKVESLMHIERYSHVMHIVSVVSGRLDDNKTPYDAFRSVFPAGTLSGAPKIRAMQLISSLEYDHRNVYGGAVGYISWNHVIDVAIAIRTLVIKNNIAYLQAGAGIVYDSVPIAEYKETIKKINGTIKAIDTAENTKLLHIQNNINKTNNNNVDNIIKQLIHVAKHNNITQEQLLKLIHKQYP